MYEVAKYEFARWINSLEQERLTRFEKNLLGVIIDNFDSIAAKGIAKGGELSY